MTEFCMNQKTALERDAEWLAENWLEHLNIDQFSDWVTRLFNDGISEEKARVFASQKMILELEHKRDQKTLSSSNG